MSDIDAAEAERHKAKMAKRKAVQDAEVAGKTVAEKGLLIVNTGPGKGKTTAAFGLALRMLGYGRRVGVVQFIKGKWHTGEKDAFAAFGDHVAWHTMGEGFTAPGTGWPWSWAISACLVAWSMKGLKAGPPLAAS